MDSSPTAWLPDNFYRSPFWRFLRASYRREHNLAADPAIDDDWIEVAKDLLAAVEKHDLSRVPPKVHAAYALWTEDCEPRWLLEAELLTNRTFSDVAAACAVPEAVVDAYHEIFFDVRPKIHARDWIMHQAVLSTPLNGFAGPQPAGVLKYAAFTGGSRVLEAVAAVVLDRPLPTWLIEGFAEDPHWGEAYFRARVKLTVAIMTERSDRQLGSLVELTDKLRELEKAAGVAVRDDPLLPVMGAVLSALERPKRKGPASAGRRPVTKAVSDRTMRPEPTPVQGGTREE